MAGVVRALEYFGGSPEVRVGIAGRKHPFDPAGPLLAGARLACGDMAAASERLHFQEQLGHAVADVFVLDALGLAGPGGLQVLHLAGQLLARFIHADDRILGVIRCRAGVDLQHVFHAGHKTDGVLLGRNAPVLAQMGHERVS